MIVVSDTSPISNLLLIGRLALLRELYQEIIIPEAVHREIEALVALGVDISALTQDVHIRIVQPKNVQLVELLSENLDPGESQAIVLATELKADLLLMDEREGTAIARQMGLKATGLLGILIEAKKQGLLPAIRPVLLELRRDAGFWLSENLERQVLESVGE